MNDFFKDYNLSRVTSKSFLEGKHTICVKYKDGRVIEHEGVTNPWQYINRVKKEMSVETAWIKD